MMWGLVGLPAVYLGVGSLVAIAVDRWVFYLSGWQWVFVTVCYPWVLMWKLPRF